MTKEEEIADLKRKLAARAGKPGWQRASAMMEERIAALENGSQYRSKETGQYVDDEFAVINPGLVEIA